MILNFAEVLRSIDQNAILRIMSVARNDADYYLTTLFPERTFPDYNAQRGNMTIRATMAGLVGMDSPYPEGGVIDQATFNEKIAKIAIAMPMTEEVLRTIQRMVREYMIMGTGAGAPAPSAFLTQEGLNFFNKVIVQAIKDTREWMRGQALTGTLDWAFNKKTLNVDYGFPDANILTERTGNNAYSGSSSKFWDDIRAQNRLLKRSARIIRIVHPDLADDISYNTVNSANVVNETNTSVTYQKITGDNRVPTGDARDTVTIIKYGNEGEVLDPATGISATVALPFIERGYMFAIGTGYNRDYRVGEGSTPDPNNELELGYTHLGPTIEGDGAMGDWGRLYTPQDRPWSLRGEGVSNCLPVVEGFNRIVVAKSAMSA